MDSVDAPIVVFDSGLGGISVLRALVQELPSERFVYFGDSANAPYGTRSTPKIRRLTLDCLTRLERDFGFKAAVIACNTATSAAIGLLRERFSQPIIGIEPALKLAAERHPGGTVAVLATQTTLREKKYAALAAQYAGRCRVVNLPCPRLVELVEAGEANGPAAERYLRRTLARFLKEPPDAVVLGCTHFPFAAPLLRRLLPESTELLDGSRGTACQTRRLLAQNGLLRAQGPGSVEFFSSLDTPEQLARAQAMFTAEL